MGIKPLRLLFTVISFCTILISSGCSFFTKSEQPLISNFYSLDADTTIGQTGLARYDGLQSISLYIQPEVPGQGTVQFFLRNSPESLHNLAQSSLASEKISQPGYYTFDFPAIQHTTLQDFFILIKYQGEGSLLIGAGPGNVYLNGALYVNKIPQDAQTAFSVNYKPEMAIWGVFKESINWFGLLAAAVLLFILPGWALLNALWPKWRTLLFFEKLGLAAGASLPIYPILMLWTNFVGLNSGKLYVWVPLSLSIIYLFWRTIKQGNQDRNLKPSKKFALSDLFHPNSSSWANISLMLILAFLILTRIWAIRSLEIPLWGDSYQHTVIAQLLVDNQGLFESWQPYAENVTFSYHFGFHSLVAVFHWLSGLSLPLSLLWTGQIINILAVISLYPLAKRLGGSQWAGVAAILAAGLLFQMPNFYTNWGRYTQLAGQVILASVVWLIWAYFEEEKSSSKAILLLCITLSGLALTHYRVTIMAVLFLLTFWLLFTQRSNLRSITQKSILIGAGSLLIILPWIIRTFYSNLSQWLANMLSIQTQQNSDSVSQVSALSNVSVYIPAIFWLIFLLSIAWGLWKREKGAALISLWWLLILIAANPHWINLPGRDILNSFAVLIAAYFPAAIMIGAAFAWGLEKIQLTILERSTSTRLQATENWLSLLLVILLSIVGLQAGRMRLYDIQPTQFALATRPDLRAADWIQENTPQSASFVVNSFFAYADSLIVGSDGGWWLPIISKRSTSLPPLTYGIEQGPFEEYRSWVNQFPAQVFEKGITHPDVLQLMQERGFEYIYVGQQQGSVNFGGVFLDLTQLLADPHFDPVYHQDRVWIFKIYYTPGN